MSERIEIAVPENRQAGIWSRIAEHFKEKEIDIRYFMSIIHYKLFTEEEM